MRYLVDTDWVIDYFHGVERAVRRLNELSPEGVGLSVIALAELYEGVFFSSNPEGNEQAMRDFLVDVEVVDVDDGVCRTFARERGRLRSAGALIDDFDLLIGSTALHHDLTLLTNNRRHFERMDGLRIVSL